MTDTFNILARRKREQAHRNIEVTIDWSGITEDELKILARNALIHNLHHEIRTGDGPFPEKVMICARAQVRKPPEALEQYDPARLKKPTVKVDAKLEIALKGLTREELITLLGSE